jgi:hypothetical protein
MEGESYRKIQATALPRAEQERLRRALRHDLTEMLIKSVRDNPPDIDLADIELVLRPGQQIDDWNVVADCGTSGICLTCITCGTCGTS